MLPFLGSAVCVVLPYLLFWQNQRESGTGGQVKSTILPTTSICMIAVMALQRLGTYPLSAASHSNQCDCVEYAHEGQ